MVASIPRPPAFCRDIFTVGVTGTNGKTSTTTWIAAALRRAASPVVRATTLGYFLDDESLALPKDYDGFIETMRTCHARGGRFAAIELTSEALARGFGRAWPCRVGVFTNLTHDHLDAHGSAEHYLASKAQLFVNLPEGGTAVLNACDSSAELISEVISAKVRTLTYAVPSRGEAWAPDVDLRATAVEVTWEGTQVTAEVSSRLPAATPSRFSVRAIGDIYAENAMAALLGAIAAGVDPAEAARAIASTPSPPGRFEVVGHAPHVVVDYAHSPDALARTLAIARQLCTGKLTVVFGAGGKRDREKRGPMGVAATVADKVILTSDNPRDEDPRAIARAIAEGLSGHPDVTVELDRAAAIRQAIGAAGSDDVVLIAGKGHESEQIIGKEARRFVDADIAREAIAQRSR